MPNTLDETEEHNVNVSFDPQAAATVGIGLGTAIAVVCSWERHRSILWAMVAGWLSWLYVIWFALTRRSDEMKSAR